jgi:hypothetical protein
VTKFEVARPSRPLSLGRPAQQMCGQDARATAGETPALPTSESPYFAGLSKAPDMKLCLPIAVSMICAPALLAQAPNSAIPHLEKQGTATQLVVDGKHERRGWRKPLPSNSSRENAFASTMGFPLSCRERLIYIAAIDGELPADQFQSFTTLTSYFRSLAFCF